METETDYLQAPPPAYSEQEFDQKISLATAISSRAPVVDEEGWEQYDPNAFENTTNNPIASAAPAVTQPSTGISSSSHDSSFKGDYYPGKSDIALDLPPTTPLRIEKKSRSEHSNYDYGSKSSTSKDDLKRALRSADHNRAMSSAGPNGQSKGQYTTAFVHDDIGRLYNKSAPSREEILLHDVDFDPAVLYSAPHAGQRENQPLRSPNQRASDSFVPVYVQGCEPSGDYPHVSTFPNSYLVSQPDANRRSLPPTPTLPRHQNVQDQSPVSNHKPYQAPVLNFDSSVAYGRIPASSPQSQRPLSTFSQPQSVYPPQIQYDPHSLYNSAVSSQLSTLRGAQNQPSSTPAYNQQTSAQVMPLQQSIQYSRPPSQSIDPSELHSHVPTAATRPDSYFATSRGHSSSRYSQYPDTQH